MNDGGDLDFLSTLGREYCEVISSLVDIEPVPQDGYEVFVRAFGDEEVTRAIVATATDEQIDRLRDIARECHESDRIGIGSHPKRAARNAESLGTRFGTSGRSCWSRPTRLGRTGSPSCGEFDQQSQG